MHARSLGATAEKLTDLKELDAALQRAKKSKGSYAIVLDTDPEESTSEGGIWWEVGVPEVSSSSQVRKAYKDLQSGKKKQLI